MKVVKTEIETNKKISQVRDELLSFWQGKDDLIDVALSCLLSGSHLLLEDVPGVGKTTFIRSLANLLNLNMKRIQFTSDLLPSDILGVDVYNPKTESFEYHRGPIFSNIVLADELNRASPRTQSALLEAMGESAVTINGQTHSLPPIFMVIASQNPNKSIGTYDLPDSQLDRFAAKMTIGYPTKSQELEIFQSSKKTPLESMKPIQLSEFELTNYQKQMEKQHLSRESAEYMQKIIHATRTHKDIKTGISTRGGLIWARLAKAYAFICNRDYVVPDDLKLLAPYVLSHRITVTRNIEPTQIVSDIFETTKVI